MGSEMCIRDSSRAGSESGRSEKSSDVDWGTVPQSKSGEFSDLPLSLPALERCEDTNFHRTGTHIGSTTVDRLSSSPRAPRSPYGCRLMSSSADCMVSTAELPSRARSSEATTWQAHPLGYRYNVPAIRKGVYSCEISRKPAPQFK